MVTVEELQQVPIFACLDDKSREKLAAKAADVRLEPGEWLIREGETPYFFVVLEGELRMVKDVMGRAQEILDVTYKHGDFFGEVPILLGAPAFVSVRALTPTRIARYEKQVLQYLIRDSAACSAEILQTMNKRILRVQEYIAQAPTSRVLVIGTKYDTDCREIRTFLALNRVPYEWVDRDKFPDRVPTCVPIDREAASVIVDRSFCVGQPPTVRKVAEALGIRTRPTKERYDVVVIGGGPAGLAAAVYGASEGLCVLLIEKSAPGGQAGTSSRIENYLGFPAGISGDELSERALKQAGRFGAEMVLTREVVNIEPLTLPDGRGPGYCVEMDGGDRVQTKTVILATGVEWRRLEATGVERLIGRGVLYGASRVEQYNVVGKDIFIVGGGNSAGQAAMFFSSFANSVTVLVRGAGLELTMSQYLIDQIGNRKNITVEPFTEVIEAKGDDHLETILTVTKDGDGNRMEPRERPADALFVMIGAKACTHWLPKGLQRDENGFICTGRDVSDLPGWNGPRAPFLLETNMPGFFCAGDVRHDSIKRVSSGVGEGSMAIAFIHQYLALAENAVHA